MQRFSERGGNPWAAQFRIQTKTAKSIGGQRAHDMRIGPQPDYVDRSRTYLNRVLIAPYTATQLRKICERRRALRHTSRAMKSNSSVGVVGIITFGHKAQKIFNKLNPDQQDAAYLETVEAIAKRLNTTVSGLVTHADESAPHAHFQLPAYDLSGHPVSATAKREVLRELQTITADVMGRHAPGLERGHSKLNRLKAGASPAEVVNRSVAQLHDELPMEIQEKEALLADLSAKIKKNERLAAAALEKAAMNDTKADKALRNAALYESRAEKARQERDVAERALSTAKAHKNAIETETAQIREAILREAQEGAEALLSEAQDRGRKEALRITEEVSKRLEQDLWSEGQKALRKVERERDQWRSAFELLRDVVKALIPVSLYQTVRNSFIYKWSNHPNNPDRRHEPLHPPFPSGPPVN